MVFRFGAFEVDEHRFELRHAGVAVPLEPRVLDVLVYLIRNRDRVVPKAELIDKVWESRFVSDAALTRCVMELRKAIADGFPEDPIKTLHRRGYRFVAAVEVAGEPEPVIQPAPAPSPQPPPQARVVPRKWIAAAAAVVIAAGAAYLATRRAAPVVIPRVAILPISAASGDGELNLLAMSIGDFLSTRLAQVPRLVVRPPDANASLSLEASSLAEFARRAGVSYVISGGVHRAPEAGKARMELLLHHFRDDGRTEETPLGRYDVPLVQGSPDMKQFRAARENVAHLLVKQLLPALDLKPDTGLAPASPQAYRLYLLARDRLSQGACDGEASVELLKRSIELDPNFAPAWETYALAEYGLASSCGEDSNHYKTALTALERARRLAPGSASAVALTATVNAEMGRLEDAYAVLHSASNDLASSADVHFAAAYVLWYTGYLKESRSRMDAALAIDPNYLAVGGWTPNVFLYQREHQRFLRWLPATDAPIFRYYRGYSMHVSGNLAGAQQTLESAFRLNPSDVFARLSNALLNVVEGRKAEAVEVLRQLERQRNEVGSSDGELTYKIAELYQMAGDSESALRQLDAAVRQGFFCAPCVRSSPTWDGSRGRPEFERVLARAEERQKAFGRRFGLPE
jgi:DNA-binding winged helix-turn-helix (wHTH) protein/tetratricopeptide (TPR) repeat protein/TolB-like protein